MGGTPAITGVTVKVVVVGAGVVGFQVTRQLAAENKNVVLIERDPQSARYASDRLDCMVIEGSGTDADLLRRVGMEDAGFFIAVSGSDETNMIACALANTEFHVPHTIARIRGREYSAPFAGGAHFLGITYVANPEMEAANAIIRSITYGAVSEVMVLEESNVQIRSITVDRGSALQDKPLEEIRRTLPIPFIVAIILRENHYIIPSGNTYVQEGDILYVVATDPDFHNLFNVMGKHPGELRKVVVVGGGKIGAQVASHFFGPGHNGHGQLHRGLSVMLRGRGRNVKIVERDYDKCKALSDRFPEALVINADIGDEGVFEEEGLSGADLVIAATDNQELNVLTAVYAKTLGVKRSIVLVTKSSYLKIASNLGIDAAVSLKNSTVDSILKFVRRGNVRSVYTISDSDVEIMEISVDASSPAAGRKVKDIRLPSGALILTAVRGHEQIIPRGDLEIEAHDHIIAIARKTHVDRVQRVFSAAS